MSTNPIEENVTEVAPSLSGPKPQAYLQLEEQLTQAEKAPAVPLRMLAVAKAMAIAFKWNEENGGLPQSWNLETNREYKEWAVDRLLEATARAITEFTEASGTEAYGAVVTEDITENAEGIETAKTIRQVWEAALTPQAVIGRKGTKLRGGGTVAGNHRAVEFVNLLRRAGGLTRDQLRFLAEFPRSQGVASQHETSETINLLVAAKFAKAHECDTWKNSQAEIYTLTTTGQNFYNLIHYREQGGFQRPELYELNTSLQQLYGANQILASISGACKVATNTGKLTQLMYQSFGRSSWFQTADEQIALRMEWEDQNYRLFFRDNDTLFHPDAAGRLILDERQLAQVLLNQANISTHRNETKFALSRLEGNAVWPFLVEYVDSSETAEAFVQKIIAYSELFNNYRAWPEKWLGRFPAILIVTNGGPRHLLGLMLGVREQLKRLIKPKQPLEWWFTTSSWFTAAYGDYIGTFNNRKKPRPPIDPSDPIALCLPEKGRIWLPLLALSAEPKENIQASLNGLNFLITSDNYVEKKKAAESLVKEGLDSLIDKMVALPILHS